MRSSIRRSAPASTPKPWCNDSPRRPPALGIRTRRSGSLWRISNPGRRSHCRRSNGFPSITLRTALTVSRWPYGSGRRSPCSTGWATPSTPWATRSSRSPKRFECGVGQPIQAMGQRDEPDAQLAQFAETHHQVGQRPAPPIQMPDHDHVDLATPRGLQQAVRPRPLPRARADVLDTPRGVPATVPEISGHRLDLQAERLLVVRRDAGVQRGAHGQALPDQKPPPDRPRRTPRFAAPAAARVGLAVIYPFRSPGSGASAGSQRSGNNSSIRLLGCVLTRSSTSRRYASGSTPRSLQLVHRLISTAAVFPPLSLPANSQFFRPMATGFKARSLAPLSISRKPASSGRINASQWFNA